MADDNVKGEGAGSDVLFSLDKRLLRRAGFSATSRSGVVGNLRRAFFCAGFGAASSLGAGAGADVGGGAISSLGARGAGTGADVCSSETELRTAGCFGSFAFRLPFLNAKPSTSSVYALRGRRFASPFASPSVSFVLTVVLCAPLALFLLAGRSSSPAPSSESRALLRLDVPSPFILIERRGERVKTMDIEKVS